MSTSRNCICIFFTKGGRYSVFPGGELHIRNVTFEDGENTFRCLAKNVLTGRKTVSSIGGR